MAQAADQDAETLADALGPDGKAREEAWLYSNPLSGICGKGYESAGNQSANRHKSE